VLGAPALARPLGAPDSRLFQLSFRCKVLLIHHDFRRTG
jgi:hypothetical protein